MCALLKSCESSCSGGGGNSLSFETGVLMCLFGVQNFLGRQDYLVSELSRSQIC